MGHQTICLPIAAALALFLAACTPPLDPAAIDASARRIEPRVARDCAVLQVAGAVATVAAIAVPGAGIVDVVIDRACDDPELTARIIAVGEEMARARRP